jgi:hypothetical protein
MSYKVDYYTLALMDDGTNGNILQEHGTVYTDAPIEQIPTILNDHLQDKKRMGVVKTIIKVEGECIGFD